MTFIQQEKSYNGKQISNNNIAVQCISNHQWLDALVLLEQEASLNQIVCYNLALCYLQAREYEKVLDKLNQAVSEVKMDYSKLVLSECLLEGYGLRNSGLLTTTC